MTQVLKFCNCAGCGLELLGESCLAWRATQDEATQRQYPAVHDRVRGRPYCEWCCRKRHNSGRLVRRVGLPAEPSPWVENAVRHLEEN